MELIGLSNFCSYQKNLGGFVELEYAPIQWVSRSSYEPIVTKQNNWLYNILFTAGGWLKVPLQPKKKAWDEQSRSSDQGKWYAQELKGITPKLSPAATLELEKMEKQRFILKLQDKNGNPWILGTLDAPFEFSSDATTGNNGELNHYQVRFFSNTPRRAHGFQPNINI